MDLEQLNLIPDEKPEPKTLQVPLAELPAVYEEPTAAFVRSLQQIGLMQPIVILESTRGYSIAFGRHRIAAARQLEWETIEAKVFPAGWIMSEILALHENSQRHQNFIHEWESIEAIAARLPKEATEGEVIDLVFNATGMPKATIRKRRKLNSLSPEIIAMVKSNRMSVSAAERAVGLNPYMQSQIVKEAGADGKISVRDVMEIKRQVREESMAELPMEIFEDQDWEPDWRVQAERLVDSLLSVVPEAKQGAVAALTQALELQGVNAA